MASALLLELALIVSACLSFGPRTVPAFRGAAYAAPRAASPQSEAFAEEAARYSSAARDLARTPGLAARASEMRGLAERVQELSAQRRVGEARARLKALERLSEAAQSGELEYRAAVREVVRRCRPGPRTRISMSWAGDDANTGPIVTWATRLGANELLGLGKVLPEVLRSWKQAGYLTARLGSQQVHFPEYLQAHPEQAQVGWVVTLPERANGESVIIPLGPAVPRSKEIATRYDPKQFWVVVDRTADAVVPPNQWALPGGREEVAVQGAVPGHEYVVYLLTSESSAGDVLLPEFQQASSANLDRWLTQYDGVLDSYWLDSVAYVTPGPTAYHLWDQNGYLYAARPERLAQFQQATGVLADPRWLVNPPRTLDAPARKPYLQWMHWVQPQVLAWTKQLVDLTHQHNMQSWFYWGDSHVGVEPFLDTLTGSGMDQIDRPLRSDVGIRSLTDLPGNLIRRFRMDWTTGNKAAKASLAADYQDWWAELRRGLLMQPINGIYWCRFEQIAAVNEPAVRDNLVETIAEVSDEFRLIADNLEGEKAWTDDLDLYVLNTWGRQYSWQGGPADADCLSPLTDLPVRVHFLSLWDVEETGIPENAKVLFCYGLPNTGQNGGSWWAEPKIANAVKEFVNRGGGIVGLQAPSAHGEDGREWPLAEVFGLAPKDAQFFRPSGQKAIVGDESDPEEPVREATETTLTPAGRGGPWAAARRDPIPGFSLDVKTAAGNRDEVLYTAQGAPGVVAREHGQGRSVWIAGVSAAPEYRRLIRNAIFWAARREAESARVEITRGDDVSVYAYPKPRIIAVHNASGRAVSATCHVDAAIVGGGGRLRDLVTNEQVNPRDGSFSIRMPSRCTRLLRAD